MVSKIKETLKKKIFQNIHGISAEAVEKLQQAAASETPELFNRYGSSFSGLDEESVTNKLKQYGLNRIQREKAPSWYKQLLSAFINPFIGILVIIAIVSLILDVWLAAPGQKDYKTLFVVSAMIIISVLLRFIQEYRSNVAAEKLKKQTGQLFFNKKLYFCTNF